MPDPLRIRIRPDWDAALTYDSLYEGASSRPVFVGRENLIAPLVAEITEPNKRGTYLISGYRGTGKTTLLIEALNRAKSQLGSKDYQLFPVVLNVSEVSASLGNLSQDAALELAIDPRRLLIALIRQIRDGISRLSTPTDAIKELATRVDYAYEKSTAAKFSVASVNSKEDSLTRLRELAIALDEKNILKTVALIAGAGAVAFEMAALVRPLGWLHAAAIALASVFAIGIVASFKRTRTEKSTSSKQTALEHDNSLHQLETDLKDILLELQKNRLRTVVVMEELDKIVDEEGKQLAAVIRYFKNLFTQAPALFFFVTDKSYFDIIATAIKRARRSRSYAVEHTFFTHRIFVGRPTTEECLRFISAIAVDEKDQTNIQNVANTLGKPGQIEKADQLGRFVRVVLFSAANHLFDLKNELRRFVRNEEQNVNGQTTRVSSFLIDDQTLPDEQAALAVFQDLIVEKTRSFEIKGGRAYANETLADSLYALFNELGSNQTQKVDFLPVSDPEKQLLLDEQLDLSEAARIREAVESLIGDLERGRAIQSRDVTANTFTWRDDAARSFRYVRQLQKHEESLIAELQRNASLANALNSAVGSPAPHPLAQEFEQQVIALRSATEPMSADTAAAEQRRILDVYGSALTDSFNVRLAELNVYGFSFEPIAQGLGGSLYLVRPSFGDPRLNTSAPRGGVLLALGDTETLVEDVWSFIRPPLEGLSPLNRAALVHVIHRIGDGGAEALARKSQWVDVLSKRAEGIPDFQFAVEVVYLAGPTEIDQKLDAVQRTTAALVGYGAWVRPEIRPYEPIPPDTPPLAEGLKAWKETRNQLFRIQGLPTNASRYFGERNDLEGDGTAVVNLASYPKTSGVFGDLAYSCMLIGYQNAVGGPDDWKPIGEWLLKEQRVILYVNAQAMYGWTMDDVLEALNAGARVIVANIEELPPEFGKFQPMFVPSPKSES